MFLFFIDSLINCFSFLFTCDSEFFFTLLLYHSPLTRSWRPTPLPPYPTDGAAEMGKFPAMFTSCGTTRGDAESFGKGSRRASFVLSSSASDVGKWTPEKARPTFFPSSLNSLLLCEGPRLMVGPPPIREYVEYGVAPFWALSLGAL